MSFKKVERRYCTPNGWRLATFEEVQKNLETIKEQRLLNEWDRARLLDGWIRGPGYQYRMGNDFSSCMGYMLLIQTEQTSGCVYYDVTLSDASKEAALFLCVEDWNLELVYWLLNSWAKTEIMVIEDVREGKLPFKDAALFEEMNRKVCSLAKRFGDKGPIASEEAAKNKYCGLQSANNVLRDTIKIVNEDQNIQEHISDFMFSLDASFPPTSSLPAWFLQVSSEGGVAWKMIADAFWEFLSDNYKDQVLELFSAYGCLASIYKLNSHCDRKTITRSQENFISATSILLYLSYYRCKIVHAPMSHPYRSYCAENVIHLAANSAKGNVEYFKYILQNNPLWRCWEQSRSYDVLNKLLVCASRGINPWNIISDKKNDILMINTLIECGAQPSTLLKLSTHTKKRALDYAVKWEDEDHGIMCIESLLKRFDAKQQQELANAADEKGRTALHRASKKGRARICQLLLRYGASSTAQDKDEKTALHDAVAKKGTDEVIDVFMEDPHITELTGLKDNRNCSPLDIAVTNGDIKSTAKLLSKTKQPKDYFDKVNRGQLLRQCLLSGCHNIVQELFRSGTKLPGGDCDEDGKTAFHLAAMCHDETNVEHMFTIISISETEENIEKLLNKCDKKRRTVLHEAALGGHAGLCLYLLKRTPKIIYTKDKDGRNPLYDAVKGKHKGTALLEKFLSAYLKKDRLDVDDLIDRGGLTPLHVAASEGKTEIMSELLGKPEIKRHYLSRADILGQTPLLTAAKRGDLDTVKILLNYGAHPLKERDCDGRTALHYAVQAKTEDKKEFVDSVLDRCKSDEEKLLLLWASAAGIGTAHQNLCENEPLKEHLLQKIEQINTKVGIDNLLKIAASLGDREMTKELITRGYQIADIKDDQWRDKLSPEKKKNVKMVSEYLERIAEQGNDQPAISDNLGRFDYAHGLAALFLNPFLKPPIAVGISGSWGMGKSSLMVQTESILLTTAAQIALLPASELHNSASDLPDIKPFELSKKGQKKYEEVKRQINYGRKVSRNKAVVSMVEIRRKNEHDREKTLPYFLNKYDLKYHKIFKSLAAMDRSDMFETNVQQLKADSSGEGNVPAVLTVQYNAWKYRSDTEALAGMAVEITKELEGIMTKAQWLSTCCRNTWQRKKSTIWIEIFFPCLLALVLACSFTWIVWVLFDSDKFREWAKAKYAWPPAAIVITVWTLTKSAMAIIKPVSTQLVNYISLPDHTDKLGYQERVIRDINFLKDEIGKSPYWVFIVFSWVSTTFAVLWRLITESWFSSFIFHSARLENGMEVPKFAPASGNNLRIIVFVDDLDRCQESVILQVLSAINLVLAVCQINVVLGMDKELIERAIIKKYGDAKANKSSKARKELADKYLQKIIQLPLDLPDPSEEQSKRFLKGQLGVFEEASTNDSVRDVPNRICTPVIDARKSGESSLRRPRENVSPSNTDARGTMSMPVDERRQGSPENTSAPEFPINMPAAPEVAQIGNKHSNSSILIREMLFVRYSQGEENAFCYFQKLATDYRKLPREWKRLLNYHRLVWYIFSLSKETKVLVGWQVQLITWIFICWEWEENMNQLIEEWDNLCILKSSDSSGPSLLMMVEYFMEKENPGNSNKKITATRNIEQDESSNNESEMGRDDPGPPPAEIQNKEKKVTETSSEGNFDRNIDNPETNKRPQENMDGVLKKQLDILEETLDQLTKEMKEVRKKIDQFMKQGSRKNEEKEEKMKLKNWKRMRSALYKYDVSMEGIQAFQRFRFYCKAGHLQWPLSKQEYDEKT